MNEEIQAIAKKAVIELNKFIITELLTLDLLQDGQFRKFHHNYFVNQEILEECIQELIKTENNELL